MSAEGWEAQEGTSFASPLQSFGVIWGRRKTPVFICPFINSLLLCSLILNFIHSFVHSFIHSFILSTFTYLVHSLGRTPAQESSAKGAERIRHGPCFP